MINGEFQLTIFIDRRTLQLSDKPSRNGELMGEKWDADMSASLLRRLGKSSHELGTSDLHGSCPDIWELDNGDAAVIGTDATASYAGRLPAGVTIDPHERLIIIPRSTIVAAKPDIPDA